MPNPNDSSRHMLRHALATLAYRGGKALRGAPADFGGFQTPGETRTPLAILAHLGDLLDWALSQAQGANQWRETKSPDWESAKERFFRSLAAFDAYLASETPLQASPEKLFQGPVADAFTHVGQIAILRRMAGAPVKGENYFKAAIAAGSVGAQQAAPRFEFD